MCMQINSLGLFNMSSTEIKEPDNKDSQSKPLLKTKEEDKDSHLKITMNKWGITFIILFAAVLSYLMTGAFVFLPPFAYNLIDEVIFVEFPGLLAALLIIALIFLGLGYYFGWIRKPVEQEVEGQEITENQLEGNEEKTLVFTDDSETKDEESS